VKQKSINKHRRFVYCKDRGINSSNISAFIYQTTRRHNPEYRNLNVRHMCFLVE